MTITKATTDVAPVPEIIKTLTSLIESRTKYLTDSLAHLASVYANGPRGLSDALARHYEEMQVSAELLPRAEELLHDLDYVTNCDVADLVRVRNSLGLPDPAPIVFVQEALVQSTIRQLWYELISWSPGHSTSALSNLSDEYRRKAIERLLRALGARFAR